MFKKKLLFFFVFFLSITQFSIANSEKLFVSFSSEGTIEAIFHPGLTIQPGKLTRVSFGIPFPKNVLIDEKLIRIIVNGKEVPSYSIETSRWHSSTNSQATSIRSVLVLLDVVFINNSPLKFSIKYGEKSKKNLNVENIGEYPGKYWVSIEKHEYTNEYPAVEKITEPTVYVTLPPKWLSQALLKSRFYAVGEIPEWGWFDKVFENYAYTAVNDVSKNVSEKEKINYISEYEPWLFDRASVLYSVYLRTGKIKWLRHAHRAAQFYSKHIDQAGFFDLKKMDAKYSYGQSLLLDLILMGDITHIPVIERTAVVGKNWHIDYKPTLSFWTERHLTYAILSTLSAWEVTGNKKYLQHLNKLIESSIKWIKKPSNGWEPNQCFLHTMDQHEGGGGKIPICSPWMTALLSDAIWKYYLHTENVELLKIIAGFGDFVVNRGSYVSNNPRFKYMVPWYLASSEKEFSDGGEYADLEHSCDVAGLLSRAAWAKKQISEPTDLILNKIEEYLRSCDKNLKIWRRPLHLNEKKPIWRLLPPRKFNWWFGTNLDMSWFLEDIDTQK